VQITDARPAGPDHEVLEVDGCGGYRRTPCPPCPWVVANTGNFPPEAFVISAPTAYDAADRMFACHDAGPEAALTCAGAVLRNSVHNLATRMAQIRGRLDVSQVREDGRELHGSYREMAVANGVSADHPALAPCRGDDE
jgi:hypothetical protein